MKTFTAWEYLLIDAANNCDQDKLRFEDRIEWTLNNLDDLEDIAQARDWKEKPLFIKAVQAIRKAQAGMPTGHLVGFDAVCSGMQLMSVLTGCERSAEATGLVDPDRRADAYTECTAIMSRLIGVPQEGQRAKVKNAVMTSLYGSKKEPKKEFGQDTPELNAFYQAMYEMAPGPCELLVDLLGSWQPYALLHAWKLPDGYDARCKVMQQVEKRIEVDELDHSTFTYIYYENEGEERGVKNAANVIHSIDAYVLRCLVRRCSYDEALVEHQSRLITDELITRHLGEHCPAPEGCNREAKYYIEQYRRSGMADPVILPYLDLAALTHMDEGHLRELNKILATMLEHPPFHLITVHDEFKCHANYMNFLRIHYRNILAELAESHVLDDILSQLYGEPGTFQKKSYGLGTTIRQSAYALC